MERMLTGRIDTIVLPFKLYSYSALEKKCQEENPKEQQLQTRNSVELTLHCFKCNAEMHCNRLFFLIIIILKSMRGGFRL